MASQLPYRMVRGSVGPVARRLFRIRVEGLENVPSSGAAILAPNHLSFIDSIFIPLVLDRRVTYVAKAEYFESWRTAWFFKMMGQIPVKRGAGSAAGRALESAGEVLRGGGLFGIYPEGTRSPDGRLYKGRTGIARLALDCHAPVIPIGVIGTREAQPIGKLLPKFFSPITIRFGRPVRFDRFADRRKDALLLRKITDEIMFEIRSLSDQEYVHQYAKRDASAEVTGAEESVRLKVVPFPILAGVP